LISFTEDACLSFLRHAKEHHSCACSESSSRARFS
jgi:hypothetical protein